VNALAAQFAGLGQLKTETVAYKVIALILNDILAFLVNCPSRSDPHPLVRGRGRRRGKRE
jgi:hypothetical protein